MRWENKASEGVWEYGSMGIEVGHPSPHVRGHLS